MIVVTPTYWFVPWWPTAKFPVALHAAGTFESRVDKFWRNQDILCNFREQLQGTGSHSILLYEECELGIIL